jgi:hypothetical protein
VYTYAVAWLRRFIGLSEPSPGGREVVGSRAAGAIEGVCWLKSANISCALPITAQFLFSVVRPGSLVLVVALSHDSAPMPHPGVPAACSTAVALILKH